MYRVCFLFFLLCIALPGKPQKQDNVWAFGMNQGNGIDFNSGQPIFINTSITGFGEANASICDTSGQLLFYTEGSVIWNRQHQPMDNGADLTGLPRSTDYPDLTVTSSTSQGALIVPMIDSPDKYYVFSFVRRDGHIFRPALLQCSRYVAG